MNGPTQEPRFSKHSLFVLVLAPLILLALLSCQTLTSAFSIAATTTPSKADSPAALDITQPPVSQAAPTSPPRTSAPSSTAPQDAPVVAPDLVDQQERLVELYEQVNPGVVAIQVLSPSGGGLGSGFVYDGEGHIVTNYHVVEGQTDLEVDFPSGLKTRGEILGIDTDSDLAVIKIDVPAEELHPLALGDSAQIKIGQTVIAIGNPFGLNGSMTVGIISALGRTLDSLRDSPEGQPFSAGDVIQTDTAINPGNSGGPLLNLNGEVVGINRAIRTVNFNTDNEPINSGVGFAVAINIVKRVIPALINEGVYDYPYLGISSLPDISLIEQEVLGLPRASGAYVLSVTANSPADRAGLIAGTEPTNLPGRSRGGDLIIAIDDQPVRQFGDLLSYIFNYKSPGDTVMLTVLRNGEEMEIPLTLGSRP